MAEPNSSAPLGGCTAPCVRSLSDSKPCAGTGSLAGLVVPDIFGAAPVPGLAGAVRAVPALALGAFVFVAFVCTLAAFGAAFEGRPAAFDAFGSGLEALGAVFADCVFAVPGVVAGVLLAALLASTALVGCSCVTALRAAVLRAVARCGRVRGRFDSRPASFGGVLGRPLLSLGTLIRTSLLNRGSIAQSAKPSDFGFDALA